MDPRASKAIFKANPFLQREKPNIQDSPSSWKQVGGDCALPAGALRERRQESVELGNAQAHAGRGDG